MILIGHRGARFEAPENTIPGFHYAVDLGLSAVEFDIRLSKDGHLVVIHDETVDRTTNGTGKVADFTLEELQALDARSIFPDWNEPCSIPTFAEVLDVVDVMSELMIEIKEYDHARADIVVPAVIAEIRGRGIEEQVTITCFDPYPLEVAQHLAPKIRRGYIGKWDSPTFLETALAVGATQADANQVASDRDVLAAAREQGLRIIGWPTNSQEDLDSVMTMGASLLCTDAPSLITELTANLT